jgi:hypothetical protein
MNRVKRPLTVRTAGVVSYSVPAPQGPGGLFFVRPARKRQSDREVRPEAAPKPSTSASVPSSVDSLAFTSMSRA